MVHYINQLLIFLNDAGIFIKRSSSRAYTGTTTFDDNIKIIFQRQSDICSSLSNKVADLGIMGLDRYKENINNNFAKIVIEKMIKGENCDFKNSNLSKREWNELMESFGFKEKIL